MFIKKCKRCPRTGVNHVPKQNILRGTFDTQIKNRTQAKRVIEHCLGRRPI